MLDSMKIIIVGAGPGGYETAVEAAKRGISVVLIEKCEVGGTCLNEGCIPTKVFCRSAEMLREIHRADEFGIGCQGVVTVDFAKVRERKETVTRQLRSGVETLLNHKLITLVYGNAVLKDAHTVIVSDDNGVTTECTGDYVILATGSVSATLPIEGADIDGVLTSKELLDIDHIPQRLCIIGAGVIGLEFASVFNAFGSKVTVLEYCKQILPRFDSDLAKRLKQSLSKSGIEIITQASVQGICRQDCLEVKYLLKDELKSVQADTVLMAVGRKPRVEDLGLNDAGVEYSPKGIAVDENMQTSVPGIYAIGDVNGKCMLAHAAIYQGIRALNHICGVADTVDLSVVPSVVFTRPEAAAVGLTEEDCAQKGIDYKCLKSFFRANGKALCLGETDGFVKLIVANDPDQSILGCHLFGPHAADLISEIAALIHCRATLADLRDTIHSHPTLSEVFHALG